MKVLIFTYSISRMAGGVFDAVRDLFTNSSFNNINCKIISYIDEYTNKDINKWGKIQVNLFRPTFFLYSSKAKHNLLNDNAEVLHMEALWRFPHLWMVNWKKKYKDKPLVCSPHGMLDPYIIKSQGKIKNIISKIFFRKGLEVVDCYHALCYKEMQDIRAFGLKQPIAIIPNGINIPELSVEYLRKDNKKHLLYLGRLHRKKGVDLLLNAISNIYKSNPDILSDWHIDIVGWDHENCEAELKKIVSINNLGNIVTFHGGLYGEEKSRMYATSDAYILPSHGEGLPMSILEAWSWKLPVIMTTHCNIPEGFEAKAAIKIDDNISSVEKGLMSLFIMNEKQRKEMGERGYKLVSENFTWDSSAKKMIHLYKWLLGEESKPDFVYYE